MRCEEDGEGCGTEGCIARSEVEAVVFSEWLFSGSRLRNGGIYKVLGAAGLRRRD